jgi:hypothetical protein
MMAVRGCCAQLAAAGRLDGLLPAAGDRQAGGPTGAAQHALPRTGVAGALVAPRHALVILGVQRGMSS